MKITDKARDAILGVLSKNKMDTSVWYLEIRLLKNGALGMGFVRELENMVCVRCGDLQLAIDPDLDTEGVLVDFGESSGKQGLLFMPDT